MRPPPEYLRETHIIGRRCREHMLDRDHFPILRIAPFIWIGHSVLRPPYRMVRLQSVHSHLVASVAGRGRTLIGGRMVEWKPGQVLLAPLGLHHAFEVAGDGPWRIAWVFFDDSARAPALRMLQPQLIEADAEDFVATVHMLTREAAGAAQPAMMEALVALLDACARRLAGADAVDVRLWRLWGQVESDLARGWTAADLARLACMSAEHLRRLCHKHYQRSPMDHLTHLRLRRAGTLLRASPEKIEEVAHKAGYASVYSFSAAFRRWSGVPPARFRRGESNQPEAGLPGGAAGPGGGMSE
jgi:AraC-like DNA-binding protein